MQSVRRRLRAADRGEHRSDPRRRLAAAIARRAEPPEGPFSHRPGLGLTGCKCGDHLTDPGLMADDDQHPVATIGPVDQIDHVLDTCRRTDPIGQFVAPTKRIGGLSGSPGRAAQNTHVTLGQAPGDPVGDQHGIALATAGELARGIGYAVFSLSMSKQDQIHAGMSSLGRCAPIAARDRLISVCVRRWRAARRSSSRHRTPRPRRPIRCRQVSGPKRWSAR